MNYDIAILAVIIVTGITGVVFGWLLNTLSDRLIIRHQNKELVNQNHAGTGAIGEFGFDKHLPPSRLATNNSATDEDYAVEDEEAFYMSLDEIDRAFSNETTLEAVDENSRYNVVKLSSTVFGVQQPGQEPQLDSMTALRDEIVRLERRLNRVEKESVIEKGY